MFTSSNKRINIPRAENKERIIDNSNPILQLIVNNFRPI